MTNQSTKCRNLGCAVLLVCWVIWQRTDVTCSTLSRTYFMRESTRQTCGTLARARRVVRYLLDRPHLAWSFPAGTQLESLKGVGQQRKRNARAALVSWSDWECLRSKRVQRRKASFHTPVAKQSCTQQLERQHAVSNCSNYSQKSVAHFHGVYNAIQPQLAA